MEEGKEVIKEFNREANTEGAQVCPDLSELEYNVFCCEGKTKVKVGMIKESVILGEEDLENDKMLYKVYLYTKEDVKGIIEISQRYPDQEFVIMYCAQTKNMKKEIVINKTLESLRHFDVRLLDVFLEKEDNLEMLKHFENKKILDIIFYHLETNREFNRDCPYFEYNEEDLKSLKTKIQEAYQAIAELEIKNFDKLIVWSTLGGRTDFSYRKKRHKRFLKERRLDFSKSSKQDIRELKEIEKWEQEGKREFIYEETCRKRHREEEDLMVSLLKPFSKTPNVCLMYCNIKHHLFYDNEAEKISEILKECSIVETL